MTMSLELGPDTERRVRAYAAIEGITIEELIDRAFPPCISIDITRPLDEIPTNLQTLLARRYAEAESPCLKHKALSRVFSGEDIDHTGLTTEEYEAELRFWNDYDRERYSCQL